MISILQTHKKVPNRSAYIGVTGAYGKTIVTHLIAHILRTNGHRVAVLSSKGVTKDGTDFSPDITSYTINKKNSKHFFKKVSSANPEFIVIEMSKEAIQQKVFSDLVLDSCVITNVTFEPHDAKKKHDPMHYLYDFISLVQNNGLMVVNGEQKEFVTWLEKRSEQIEKNIYCYWMNTANLTKKSLLKEGIHFNYYDEFSSKTKLHGFFNFANIYLAVKLCNRYIPLPNVLNALQDFTPLAGKFDRYQTSPFQIFIEDAKHPYQVERSLLYLHRIKQPSSKIISVISVPETKDVTLIMKAGEMSAQYSDIVILCAGDSNTTHSSEINSLLHKGAAKQKGMLVERIFSTDELEMLDKGRLFQKITKAHERGDIPVIAFDAHDHTGRLDAIKFATQLVDNDDIVYVSGKGDERSILFNNVEYEWSDYEALRIALEELMWIKKEKA